MLESHKLFFSRKGKEGLSYVDMASSKKEDDITEIFQSVASTHCDDLIDALADKELDSCIEHYRTAFISYVDAFQNAFRLAVERRFDSNQIGKVRYELDIT